MKVLFSLLLGGLILYWMYRDFDFKNVGRVLVHEMDWTWMLLSFPFGVLAQMLRGWRWQMSLEPIGEHARASVSVNSIFLSYAVSLVVPRVGEFARCGVLKRYDGVSFTKALGTVVTERIIDSLLVLAITLVTLFSSCACSTVFQPHRNQHRDALLTVLHGGLHRHCRVRRCRCGAAVGASAQVLHI